MTIAAAALGFLMELPRLRSHDRLLDDGWLMGQRKGAEEVKSGRPNSAPTRFPVSCVERIIY